MHREARGQVSEEYDRQRAKRGGGRFKMESELESLKHSGM